VSALPSRPLGKTGVALSVLTFGSMRMLPARLSVAEGVALLSRLIDGGVSCLHVSSEYESFPYFAEIFRGLRAERNVSRLRFIAKAASPHFGEDAFHAGRFEAKIDCYLQALGIDTVDVAQWLLRFDLAQPDRRVEIFERDAGRVSECVDRLRGAGKIRAMVSFPYDEEIALRALALPACDGLALYVNPFETELAHLLDRAEAAGKSVIAIRPLAAGRVTGDERVRAAFQYALAHPAVVTTVASLNSLAQAETALAALSDPLGA
jgi:aryl-alcohol dehydrogenase-like predicted oxidoreductase